MDNSDENCKGHLIFLVSSNCLQTQLLVAALNKVATWYCICSRNLTHIPANEESPARESLVMLDCFGFKPHHILASLKSEWKPFLRQHKVSLFNLSVKDQIEIQAMSLGVRGFFYEKDQFNTLKKGIQAILNQEIWVSRQKLTTCLSRGSGGSSTFYVGSDASRAGLTAREREILSLLVAGASNSAIAKALFISTNTVRTHNTHIFKKIKVANRLEAAVWGNKHL